MKDYTVACIGAGYFSQFHYDAWKRIDGVRLVASVDRDIDRARSSGVEAYTDPIKMLAAHGPDIVDIITPPPTHLEMIKAALATGPKVIICQKPFCANPSEAREAIALAAGAATPIVVHENFRFQPWYRVIRDVIEAGRIGEVLQLTFRLRPGDGQGPEAYLERQPYFQRMERFLVHETAVHWIDTFRFLMGEPDRLFADLRRMNPVISGEDAGYILFSYPDGKRALFDGNRLLDHSARNTRCTMGEALIEGTEGAIQLFGDGSVRLRRFGNTECKEILEPTTHAGFGGDCVYHLQMHVVEALRGNGSLENEASDYMPVMAAEEAVYRSSKTGCWEKPLG